MARNRLFNMRNRKGRKESKYHGREATGVIVDDKIDWAKVPMTEPKIKFYDGAGNEIEKPFDVVISMHGTCPKCGAVTGNDWSQCNGVCPIPFSPHYVKK